jgi:hypothetical protein
MANDDRIKITRGRTPESAAMLANVKRAMEITANLNRLTFNDADQVRALFSDLIGKQVDESFVYSAFLHNGWSRHQYWAQRFHQSELHIL